MQTKISCIFPSRLILAALALAVAPSVALAGTIPIAGVSCTGYFNESESFPCLNAIDGRVDDSDGSPGNWSFWLGRSYLPQEALTFDLASSQLISGFTIYDTHNREWDDRGTLDFRIFLSSSAVDPNDPATYGTLLVDDALVYYTSDPNPAQYFTLAAPATGQYVTFVTDSMPSGIRDGVGISEFQVNGVPEPSAFLPAGLAVAALLSWRRRRTSPRA